MILLQREINYFIDQPFSEDHVDLHHSNCCAVCQLFSLCWVVGSEMPENLHCNTDYNNQIRCECKRDTDTRCVFYFKYKSRRLNHTFVGLMERSTTRSVFYPDDGSTYVFQSFQKYNVEIDCEGVKYSGVFKPSCAIVTDAPTVSCEIGTCVFEARSHEQCTMYKAAIVVHRKHGKMLYLSFRGVADTHLH